MGGLKEKCSRHIGDNMRKTLGWLFCHSATDRHDVTGGMVCIARVMFGLYPLISLPDVKGVTLQPTRVGPFPFWKVITVR